MAEHLNRRFKNILTEINDPEINPEEVVFHSLRHTSASTKLLLSNGELNYNSVKHAGGWVNLDILTRRYGAHSFKNDREKFAQKMDDFLDTSTNVPAVESDTEQALRKLAQANPDLLMRIVRSIKSANTD